MERQKTAPLADSNDAVFVESNQLHSNLDESSATHEEHGSELAQLKQHYFVVLRTDGRFVMFLTNLDEGN